MEQTKIIVLASTFLTMLERVKGAALRLKKGGEKKGLHGIKVEAENGNLRMIATNRYRLAMQVAFPSIHA